MGTHTHSQKAHVSFKLLAEKTHFEYIQTFARGQYLFACHTSLNTSDKSGGLLY